MIFLGCIEFHLKVYKGWIIIIELRVLLITHYLIREILVEVRLLDVHVRGVKKKVSRSRYCNNASSTKKRFMKKYLCWFTHRETICSLQDHGRKDG